MALSTSPRKFVPLSTGDDTSSKPKQLTTTMVTRRAFFCGVVVEGPDDGSELSEEVQDLVASLGDSGSLGYQTSNESEMDLPSLSGAPSKGEEANYTRKRAMTDASTLADLLDELVTTERTYVKRLRILKDSYADPLRSYARSRDTAIIPAYEAKILFGNIDHLVPVNEAFLRDLEMMQSPAGPTTVGGIGDVALHHFKSLHGFDCYKQYYVNREEAQAIFKKEITKKSSTGFSAFIERIKYSTAEGKSRVGLRELLMEPIQRIPRYTLLFRTMIKHMAPDNPQRARLAEAEEIASRIALAETDDQTTRAASMYALGASIEGFPPGLISNSRQYIDCIDVEDNCADGWFTASSTASISTSNSGTIGATLHCTLFLFDDKLIIVKRPNGEKSGRALAGLDNLEKFTNGSGFPKGSKKSGMIFKGMLDITDVVATDVSGTDMHIYMEVAPQDQSERWSGRPFRILSVVHPPFPVNHIPLKTEADKKRFLDNLWTAQAKYRTKAGQSVVLCAEDRQVDANGGKITLARTYFNIYQRTTFLKEPKKCKVAVHIDASGDADPVPFGMHAPPYVVIRIQPMPGDLSRFTVSSTDPDEDPEQEIVRTEQVSGRIVQTIHQYGLFNFKTNSLSRPATPTASTRTRAHKFGLDVISRNLFNARPGAMLSPSKGVGPGDVFGPISSTASVNHSDHIRTRSATSKASTSMWPEGTMSTATTDSMMKFSQRSMSTAATSIMEEESFIARSVTKSKRLIKKTRSKTSPSRSTAFDSGDESEKTSPIRSHSRSTSRGREPIEYSDEEDGGAATITDYHGLTMDQSELELSLRLELARKNSKNQHGKQYIPALLDIPVEETIYEEEPPVSRRAATRNGPLHPNWNSSAGGLLDPPRPRSTTPTPGDSPRKGRSTSRASSDRRPIGPRPPSPLPPPALSGLPSMDIDLALERTLVNLGTSRPQTPVGRRSPLPPPKDDKDSCSVLGSPISKLKRQPFESMGNIASIAVTPKANGASGIEPLSIKKKISTRTPPSARRSTYTRNSLSRRGPSPQITRKDLHHVQDENVGLARAPSVSVIVKKSTAPEKLMRLCETTKEDLESCKRAIKRIKLEVNASTKVPAQPTPSADEQWLRSPTRRIPANSGTPQRSIEAMKEAQQRMDEMRQAISKRAAEGPATPIARTRTIMSPGPASQLNGGMKSSTSTEWAQTLNGMLDDMEVDVTKIGDKQQLVWTELQTLTKDVHESANDLEKTRTELRSTKRQCELVKKLLEDATAENEIMYEFFNEELEGMFNDANLPEDESWAAMSKDLRQTKESRNNLTKENAQLKRRLQEVEMQRDEWATLLRSHGLIA